VLNGKTIIVTGAASGIGKETAAELKRQGAAVIGVDRNPTGDVDEFFETDLSDPALIDALAEELPSGADGLCNIAGLPPTAPARLVLGVNAKGLQRFTERMVPKLANGASIVNVASLAGNRWRDSVEQIREFEHVDFDGIEAFVEKHHMDEGSRSYFFSKEVVVVWTMQNRWTWRDRGIRMNSVSPGPIDTPIFEDFMETLGERASEAMRVMDRVGLPADVAPVIAFMLSDAAAWMRGTNVAVDGGMSGHHLAAAFGLD
jgi:NAD(P)-dependent dehydrogenase (short-subunit alcohol dehydrogenase family)